MKALRTVSSFNFELLLLKGIYSHRIDVLSGRKPENLPWCIRRTGGAPVPSSGASSRTRPAGNTQTFKTPVENIPFC